METILNGLISFIGVSVDVRRNGVGCVYWMLEEAMKGVLPQEEADAKGLAMTRDESREIVYGEPYEQWRAKHQKDATPEQKAAFEKAAPKH